MYLYILARQRNLRPFGWTAFFTFPFWFTGVWHGISQGALLEEPEPFEEAIICDFAKTAQTHLLFGFSRKMFGRAPVEEPELEPKRALPNTLLVSF